METTRLSDSLEDLYMICDHYYWFRLFYFIHQMLFLHIQCISRFFWDLYSNTSLIYSISIFYILINTKGNGNPSMTNGSHCCGTWFLMCLFQGNMFSGNNVSDLLWSVQSFYLIIFVCGYIVKHYLSRMDCRDMITHFV